MLLKANAILLLGASLMLVGCGANHKNPEGETAIQSSNSQSHKAGAQLWAENCSRCHNIRPPQGFSDSQWQAITHHMRLRANLTGEETRKITEFLQAGH